MHDNGHLHRRSSAGVVDIDPKDLLLPRHNYLHNHHYNHTPLHGHHTTTSSAPHMSFYSLLLHPKLLILRIWHYLLYSCRKPRPHRSISVTKREQFQPNRSKVFYFGTFLTFLLASVVLFEGIGRFRFLRYHKSHSKGNALGFYHEMNIDVHAFLRQEFPTIPSQPTRLLPASAFNAMDITNWIAMRRRTTNGKKFLVGCTGDWRGYVLRSFLHMFEGLQSEYDWQDLNTDDPIGYFYEQDKHAPPTALFFCLNSFHYPIYLLLDHVAYFQELRRLGTVIYVWNDDLQYYDQFNPVELREKIFTKADVLVGTYAYLMGRYFQSVTERMNPKDLPITLWLPHSSSPDFTKAPFNEHPIDKILLSGKTGENWYPTRHWLGKFQQEHPVVMDVYAHAGYYVPANQSETYASYLRAYRIGITSTLIFQYMIAKIFEIPSTGALLLVNQDLAPLLSILGMKQQEHYVSFDVKDPSKMIWWAVNPENRAEVDRIRKRGMHIARNYHMVQNRIDALNAFVTTGSITYSFNLQVEAEVNHPPCPMIAIPSHSVCERRFSWNARYKCDIWFCGLKSLWS